ncbi:MAG: acetyl-CoA carboxylase biotin carboxyl carrier protein [Lachnospiraceae bacterium]|nr:acetyl-CoA carboxylase biotin carboxyl carrier protein [Lachnospiraceae bacterium]
MEFEQIIRLIETVSASELTSFTLEEGDTKISLRKQKQEVNVVSVPQVQPVESVVAQTVSVQGNQQTEAEVRKTISGNEMKSPLVGTFYNAPSPDAEPYVKVGDRVSKGQTLGIIEAMKLMNEIECEFDGVIKEILVDNMDMVEYGQTLFIIE